MLTYEVDIAEEGMYEFGISYYPVAGNGSSIQRSFFVDGELSYRELSLIEFSRVWVNTSDIWDEDNQGNDLKPTQMEAPEWLFSRFYDQDGYVTEPLSIFLTDSCGMLLSAIHEEEGEEKLHLLMVDNHIPAGAKLY